MYKFAGIMYQSSTSSTMINIKDKLSARIHIADIHLIINHVQSHDLQEELYKLVFDADDFVSYQTLWVLTHFSVRDGKWLNKKLNELIDESMICKHHGKRRLLLTMIYRQPLAKLDRIDFLDFCLERMISKDELPAVHSVCMKIAYELCRPYPELLQELRVMLDIMQPEFLMPSSASARKKVLKAINRRDV